MYNKCVFIFFALWTTNKNVAQDFSISFDVTYKNDFQKTNQSARKLIGNLFDKESKSEIRTDSLELAAAKKQYVNQMSIAMPMVLIPELSKYKMVGTKIKDSIHQEIKMHKNDSLYYGIESKFSDLTDYYKDESHLLLVEEDSTDIKVIDGFKCHKIYLNYVQDMNTPELSFTISRMYVTDKIRMPYHPVIKFKSILEKYFPLEIINNLQLMKGFEIIYTLKELKTNNRFFKK